MSVGFGTSGVRGLAVELTDLICYSYTKAFLELVKEDYSTVALAGDFRPSTHRIKNALARAIKDTHLKIEDLGLIPTPTLAYYCFQNKIPGIMVTGSHIPADRNGIKFYLATREVLKPDETLISQHYQQIVQSKEYLSFFTPSGEFKESFPEEREVNKEAKRSYVDRYLEFFPAGCLIGKKLVVYQHSSVLRDILPEILVGLGAEVITVGRAEEFIPVDTEAVREEDLNLAHRWAQEYHPFAILSQDGDGDRPLLFDEQGEMIRGDVLGIFSASYLKADYVITPVSSNTALEKCGWFKKTSRTKIGSPYVIAEMNRAIEAGYQRVVAYEANGGFLTATSLEIEKRFLAPLPTRDAVLPLISTLLLAEEKKLSLSQLVQTLPPRFTYSQRLKNFPQEKSKAIIDRLSGEKGKKEVESLLGEKLGKIEKMDYTDGVRITFTNQQIVHFRPSGNAPEFRCYTEANSLKEAQQINQFALEKIISLT